ncbi:MAG: selenoneine biosynthesis selenosugar synthase SenB [Burkholderiaceae bacterium]
MSKPHIVIISPASAKANNGNWRTAQRWKRFLHGAYRVSIVTDGKVPEADAMIALHARRSAEAIAAYARSFPNRPLIVVLTGTDLYRDIHADSDAQRSLKLASALVVLQEAGLDELPSEPRAKASVIYQSASVLKAVDHTAKRKHCAVSMVGHLREEKDPLTFLHAVELAEHPGLRFVHIGAAADPFLEQEARALQMRNPRYRWLGNLMHGRTRQLLKRSCLTVIASKMEGGANVIAEAVTSGVPVLASDISGNRGMLGNDYCGYFPLGDSRALAMLIDRAARDTEFHGLLQKQCAARAPLFSADRERTALLQLMDNALNAKE